jgi:hypothetical protein
MPGKQFIHRPIIHRPISCSLLGAQRAPKKRFGLREMRNEQGTAYWLIGA